ncbi:hypothetical protein GCM10022237_26000 [Nocardioides ginsengisoli]|uniref:SHOCT domain-containing protein n=1 Tax=Nocardioides ginsengisoli TaxID=363868 RepID=A0ABW3W6A7_9ACTN
MSIAASGKDQPRPPSLLRSVLPPVLFMLLCGVVGPVFLIIGLNVGDEPGSGWLLPTGIGVTVLDLVIGGLLGRGRYRSAQRSYRLHRRGRSALATVLAADSTNVQINNQPLMALRLRIHGADITPFEVSAKKVIPSFRLPLLYAGDLPVLVDPESREWEIQWGEVRPVAPPAAVPAESPADRLAELDGLLAKDLISRDEYDATRRRILDEI